VRLTRDLVEDLEMLLGPGSVQLGGDGQKRMKRLAQQQLFKEEQPVEAPAATGEADVPVDAEMELAEVD
jgi:hypothetical protein